MTDPTPLPAAPDWRALCQELLQPLAEYDCANPYHDHRDLITRTRAALATTPAATREAGPLPPEGAEIIPPRELVRELATQWFSEIWAVPALVRVASSDLFVAAKGDAWARAQAATHEAEPLPKMPTLRALLHPHYEPGDGSADGAQLVDGNWWHPIMGCDSLQGVVDNARAVLARWGGAAVPVPVPVPVPVSERLPSKPDLDENGRYWVYQNMSTTTHWLPHWALPVPAAGKGDAQP